MQVVSLQAGAAYAEWVPSRGGLLAELHLAAEGGLGYGVQPVLWRPDPEFYLNDEASWLHGGMPVLFPFAGRVWWEGREGFYEVGGRLYEMPIHGFAHRFPWQIDSIAERRLCLVLESDKETLRYFPWHFRLRVSYELSLTALKCRLEVKNLGYALASASPPAMPVASGFHPYFFLPAAMRRQSRLDFVSHEIQLVTRQGAAGLIKAGSPLRSHFLNERGLHNLILRKVRGNQVGLFRSQGWPSIQVKAQGDQGFFVLWSKRDQDFFCIEPWMGLPNALHSGEGLRQLAKGDTTQFSFTISQRSSAVTFARRMARHQASWGAGELT